MVGYQVSHITSILPWGSYLLVELGGGFSEKPGPGTFFMLRDPDISFHLSRPFSVFSWSEGRVSFLIRVVGRFTEALSKKKVGDALMAMGPLGNGFPDVDRALLVAGGVGVAPLSYLWEELGGRKSGSSFLWGVASSCDLVPWVRSDGILIATEDGSFGFKGTVVDLLSSLDLSGFSCVLSCGPMPMVRALSRVLPDRLLESSYVSLEERMACGLGLCYGCSVMTASGPKRVCIDGPVFPLKDVI